VLAALVRDFDRDAGAVRKRITDFMQSEPEGFYLAAVEILKNDADSRASQYLVALLVYGNLLFRALCDPAFDRERATELGRQAQRGDPAVDVKLARELATAGAGDSGVPADMAERLLEIIDKISDGKRILPSLMRLLRNDNPYLRSKVVLMIGRSGQSLGWIEKRLQETDTRVRANAIEAMWGIDSEQARQLLLWATRDSNNRVVGNALVGLYRLGEISALAELVKMAGHDAPAFRRTAAWVMGETGDARFSEILGRMIADSNANVRKTAFAAVRRVRTAAAQVAQAAEWAVAVSASPKNPRTGERAVSVAVVTADGRGNPKILPAQLHLIEDGQPVWSYRVTEKMLPGPMSVLFLFPRKRDQAETPWDQGALRCLKWKRSTDLWSSVPYSGAESNAGPAELDLPSFIANASRAARAFQETPKRGDCTGFWTAVRRAVLPGDTPQRGQRHMIVVAADEVGGDADDALISAVQASRTSIHLVSSSPNPALQEFCGRIGGRFQYVADNSAIEAAVSLAYLSLLARYEIRYQAGADATNLKVRVHTPAGWGEATL
jgi:hypothetical protein